MRCWELDGREIVGKGGEGLVVQRGRLACDGQAGGMKRRRDGRRFAQVVGTGFEKGCECPFRGVERRFRRMRLYSVVDSELLCAGFGARLRNRPVYRLERVSRTEACARDWRGCLTSGGCLGIQ